MPVVSMKCVERWVVGGRRLTVSYEDGPDGRLRAKIYFSAITGTPTEVKFKVARFMDRLDAEAE